MYYRLDCEWNIKFVLSTSLDFHNFYGRFIFTEFVLGFSLVITWLYVLYVSSVRIITICEHKKNTFLV